MTASVNYVNLSEYARQRGCTSQTVKVAIESGKLRRSVRQKSNGKWEVLPDAANIEWEVTRKNTTRDFSLSSPVASNDTLKPGTGNGRAVDVDKVPLFEAQRRHETAKAEMAEMKRDELRGQLVNTESVKKEAFNIARNVRDSMLNIPDRVAAEFAGMTSPHSIHARLIEEIHKALEAMATV